MKALPYQVLLYYNYVSVVDPEAERLAQRQLCEELGLKGRILLGTEGINGTVAGTIEATQAYMDYMAAHPSFASTQFKVDLCEFVPFPKLRVRVREEIVTLGAEADPAATATHLSPAELHELLASRDDVVMFDARNDFESAIGRFKGAVTPDIKLFKDLPEALDQYEDLKDKTVVTYCTGGIRCEKASALMKSKGFKDIYQLDGGIINYAKQYPDGEFEGSVFVFDDRLAVKYGDGPDIGKCWFCGTPTSNYMNCADKVDCNRLTLRCDNCTQDVCSEACQARVSL